MCRCGDCWNCVECMRIICNDCVEPVFCVTCKKCLDKEKCNYCDGCYNAEYDTCEGCEEGICEKCILNCKNYDDCDAYLCKKCIINSFCKDCNKIEEERLTDVKYLEDNRDRFNKMLKDMDKTLEELGII